MNYSTYRTQAKATLAARAVNPARVADRIWRNHFISGRSVADAADAGEAYIYNNSVRIGRRRRNGA